MLLFQFGLKTNIDTYFLTLNAENIFNFYSQSDYVEQYKSHQFSLKINGAATSKSKSIKTYYQNAELPLMEILSFTVQILNGKIIKLKLH